MADIFISYKTEDHDRIQPLAEALEADGYDVWWDREIIAGTDDYGEKIALELTNAKCVIIAWSKLSAQSSWVKDEALIAYKEKRAIPILLVPMQLPLGFGQVQAQPFFEWNGGREEPVYRKLLVAISTKLKQPPPPPPPPPPPNRPWIVYVATAVIAALIGAGGWYWYWNCCGPTPSEYRVLVQFFGIERSDVRAMMRRLQKNGWRVDGIQGGGEARPEAKDTNEVRYKLPDDGNAAKLLANQVQEEDLASAAITVKPNQSVDSRTLEVWISRPVVPPPTTAPTPSPQPSPPFSIDSNSWNQPPDRAYCFQRKDSPASSWKFLVRCFQTNDTCLRIQRTDSGQKTLCTPTTGLLSAPIWKEARKGIEDSWFKYSQEQLPSPFPQF